MMIRGTIKLVKNVPQSVKDYVRGRNVIVVGRLWKEFDDQEENGIILSNFSIEDGGLEAGYFNFTHSMHECFVFFLKWIHEYSESWSLRMVDMDVDHIIPLTLNETGFKIGNTQVTVRNAIEAMAEAVEDNEN